MQPEVRDEPAAVEPAAPRAANGAWSAVIGLVVLLLVVGAAYAIANSGDDDSAGDPVENARELIADTQAAISKYQDIAVAEADGFVPLNEVTPTGWYQHLMHSDRIADADALDPDGVESLVYYIEDDGTPTLISAMYVLPPDQSAAGAPTNLGDLAHWHGHSNMCWDADEPGRYVGEAVDGRCEPPGVLREYQMLHVWVVDNTCGPFAGLPGHGNEGGVCQHDHAGSDVEGMTLDQLAASAGLG